MHTGTPSANGLINIIFILQVRQDFLQLMLDAGKYGLDEEGKEDLQGVEAEEEDTKTGKADVLLIL